MECSVSGSTSEYLDMLYEEYDSFDVQQTTVAVDREEFDVVDERPDGVAIRVRVEGEEGVIAVPDGDGWVLPGGVIDTDIDRETVSQSVEEWTGVECSAGSLDRVSLVCLQCEATGAELWTVSALLSATATGGSVRDGVAWVDRETRIPVPSP